MKKASVPSRRIDLGAASNWSAPASAAPLAAPVQSQDLFSLADAAPIPQSRSVDLLGNAFGGFSQPAAAPAPAQVSPAPSPAAATAGGSFWDDAAAPVSAPVQQHQPQMDLFGSPPPSQPTPTQSGPPPGSQFDLLGSMSPMTASPAMSSPATTPSVPAAMPAAPKQVGSMWQSGNKGKVNIDLTNLGRPQQQKKAMSMNQMGGSNVTSPTMAQFSPQMSPMGMPQQRMPNQMAPGFGYPQQQHFGQQQQFGQMGFGQQMGQGQMAQGFQGQQNPQMNQMTQQMGQMNFGSNQNKNNNLGNFM